jgi:hypothetical protein
MKARLTPEQIRDHKNAKMRRSYYRNRTKRLDTVHRYYQEHAEECKAQKRVAYYEHPEVMIERSKTYRQAHLEERRQKDRERYNHIKDDPAYKEQRRQRYEAYKERDNQRRRDFNRTPEGKAYFMQQRIKHQDSPLLKENKYKLLWLDYLPCQDCGSYDRREVDHITEKCNGGSDELDNLRVLCFTHHRKSGYGRHSTWRASD